MSEQSLRIDEDALSTRRLNLEKKKFKCLGWCGRMFLTDRCHRICRACKRRNRGNNGYDMQRYKLTNTNEVYLSFRDTNFLDDKLTDEWNI